MIQQIGGRPTEIFGPLANSERAAKAARRAAVASGTRMAGRRRYWRMGRFRPDKGRRDWDSSQNKTMLATLGGLVRVRVAVQIFCNQNKTGSGGWSACAWLYKYSETRIRQPRGAGPRARGAGCVCSAKLCVWHGSPCFVLERP